MNTRESGSLYRSGRRFGLRRTPRPVRLSSTEVPLAQRRWLLPGALGVLVVGVLAGTTLAARGLSFDGHATLTPVRSVGTPQPGAPLPDLATGPSPLPEPSASDASPLPEPSASDASPSASASGAGAGAPVTPSVGALHTASSQCLDVGNPGNGAGALAVECVGADQQRWQLNPVTSDQYAITNGATGKCLAAENGSREDGARIVQLDCREGAEQRWLLHWQPDRFTLANVNSGRCAAVGGDRTVRQRDCGDGDSQRWSARA